MPKRFATQSPAELAAAAEAAADEVAFAAHFELLHQAKLPETCLGMMEAMMPCCLRTPKRRRHALQERVLSALERLFAEVLASKQALAADAESALEAARAAVPDAVAALEPARARAAEARAARDRAAEAGGAGGLGASAKAMLAWATAKVQASEQALATATSRLDALALFERLRERGLENEQASQQDVERLARAVNPVTGAVGLLDALPLALRTPPEHRGAFAQRVIEESEAAVRRAVDEATREVQDAKQQLSEARSYAAAAEADRAKAKEIHGSRLDRLCACENDLVEAQDEATAAVARLSAAQSELTSREAGAKECQETLAAVQRLMEQVRTHAEVSAEKTSTEPSLAVPTVAVPN